jgi:hypothetical protein
MRVPHDNQSSGVYIDLSNPLNILLLCGSLLFSFAIGTTAGEYWQELELRNAKIELKSTSETIDKQQQKMVSRWELVDEFCSTYPTIEE